MEFWLFVADGVAFNLANLCASISSAGAENRLLFNLACIADRWYSDGLGIRIELLLESSGRPLELPLRAGEFVADSPEGWVLLTRLSWIICFLISSIVPCFVRTAYILQSAKATQEVVIFLNVRPTIIKSANCLYHPGV